MKKMTSVRLRHLLILLTALGLLPIALVGAWGISATVEQQRRELERSMLDLSRALASAVEAELDSTIGALSAMSYHPALIKGDVRSFYTTANETILSRPDWASMNLTDAKGQLIFKTRFPFGSIEDKIVDSDSLARAIQTRLPVVGRVAPGQSRLTAVPVRVPLIINGEVNYILTAAIKPDRILEILQRQKIPPDWVISVQDAGNLRVARSREHERWLGTPVSPSLIKLMAGNQADGSGISQTSEGAEVLTAFTRVARYGWAVAIGAPTAELRTTLQRFYGLYAAVIGASLAIYIVLALGISRRIVSAIDGLQEQTARLGRGEPVHVQENPLYEVNQMGHALAAASQQRMTAELEREGLMHSLNSALASQQAALASAEEANRAKDNFLAVLGHELRNPLAPIVSGLDLMEVRGETSNLRERQIIRRQVNHMRRMVDDLLDVSRITQGKLDIRKQPVNLQSVLEQALDGVQPAVQKRSRPIVVAAKQPAWVVGDETRLVQVLTNLLMNALRYDPDGVISVALVQENHQARLTVRDQGAGMLPEIAAQVFHPFYQAPQSLARSSGGLGLGLAIVRSIVELHGGSVAARSDGLNKGSQFEVVLPAIDAPSTPRPALEPLQMAQRPARILVVDDNVDAAETIADILRISGHHVQVAHDASFALALLAGFTPDLAILDLGLPDMDGFALAQAIRKRLPEWTGALVALTGYGQEADIARTAEAGFDMHFIKPVNTADLLRAVGQVNSHQDA